MYTGGLQGAGDTRSPLYITLASQIGVPIGLRTGIQLVRAAIAHANGLALITLNVKDFARFKELYVTDWSKGHGLRT